MPVPLDEDHIATGVRCDVFLLSSTLNVGLLGPLAGQLPEERVLPGPLVDSAARWAVDQAIAAGSVGHVSAIRKPPVPRQRGR